MRRTWSAAAELSLDVLRIVLLTAMVVGLSLAAGGVALGATPEPSLLGLGDPRSDGQGPGLVGSPLFVALVVLALGVGAAAVTLLAVRLTRDDR